jgi:transposase
MELYSGLDLHSKNTYIGILDIDFKRVFKKRVSNNLDLILETLEPFRDQLKGLVVESTYNWYWLVDGLMDAGYGCVHLANPSAIKQYEGLKHSDDQHDAFFLAQLSLQSLITRCSGQRISSNQIRTVTSVDLKQLLTEEHLVISAQANLDSISFLKQQIHGLEKVIKNKVKLSQAFNGLLTVPGIGNILAMTIMLEVGDIGRFAKVGNFTSYCRCAPTKRLSDGKSKGSGNRKNGNRYLSWAFSEAAQMARRYNASFRRYYDRKAAQTNTIVARRALSNKLARVCYYIMRDQVIFNDDLILH